MTEKLEETKVQESKGHPRFTVGELLPFKGVWFVVKEVSKQGLVLEAKAFTAKGVVR
jgi:hypothetical protein